MKAVICKISVAALMGGLLLAGTQACGDGGGGGDDEPARVEPERTNPPGGGDAGARTPTAIPTATPPGALPTLPPPGPEPTIVPPPEAPTPVPTATGLPEPTALSEAFGRNCAGCHGADGSNGFAPKLGAGGRAMDFEGYRTTVRGGRGGMPPFPEARISDAELANDHRYLELQRR